MASLSYATITKLNLLAKIIEELFENKEEHSENEIIAKIKDLKETEWMYKDLQN